MLKNTIEVSVIIVCMNNVDKLFPCIDSIKSQTKTSFEIIVVAYMFSKDNLLELQKRYPDIIVCVNNEIKGFSENNNIAIRKASGDYLFIVNDDTVMKMPVIDCLMDDFRKLPKTTAIVSPATYYMNGELQSCGRPQHTLYTYLLFLLGLWKEQKIKSKYVNQKGLFKTYDIVGAAFLVRHDVYKLAGGFDERFFFCPEDIALSTKINKMGYYVYADSEVRILHMENGTASKIKTATLPAAFKGEAIYYSNDSIAIYFLISLLVIARCGLKYILNIVRYKISKDEIFKIGYVSNYNIIRAIMTKATPKEIFIYYYNKLRIT